jgi:hypothetical protein
MINETNIRISESVQSNGFCTIWLNNIGLYVESMRKCIKIIKYFAKGDSFYIGNYRIDGINLTNNQMSLNKNEIYEYFLDNGKYEMLDVNVQKGKIIKNLSGYLWVGCLPVIKETYEILPKIFHYYLDTIIFCPNIEWTAFVESYRNFMRYKINYYIMNRFADFLFSYNDISDFSISFNINLYGKEMVHQNIQTILFD